MKGYNLEEDFMANEKDISQQTTERLEVQSLAAEVRQVREELSALQRRVDFSTNPLAGISEEKLLAAGVRKCFYCKQGFYKVRFDGRTVID
jgi:hypothetical protein